MACLAGTRRGAFTSVGWNAICVAPYQVTPRSSEGLSTPGNKVAENGNKLLAETATLTGAATMLPFRATICCLVWTGLETCSRITKSCIV